MTIFLALNEELKAPVRMLNVPDFNQKVKSLTGDRPANQTVIRKEFEVDKVIKLCHLIEY